MKDGRFFVISSNGDKQEFVAGLEIEHLKPLS